MRMFIGLCVFLALVVGCTTTPDLWGPEEHRRMLMQCRVACGKGLMTGYDAWTAICSCRFTRG